MDDGTPAEGIAYWADSTWQLYGDLDHAVWKLRVLDDTLYAVGSFDMADGQPANGIARRQGGQWVPVGQLPADEMNWWDVTKYQGRLITLGNGYINGLRGIYELVNDEWSVLGPGFTGGISGAQSMVEFQGDLYVGGQILLQEGNAGQANYAASKAGIIGFTKSIALELGSRNIRCNAIAPGFIETEMTAVLNEETVKQWRDSIPLKRGGTPEDIANCVIFLASDLSSYITGQVIQVDVGMLT